MFNIFERSLSCFRANCVFDRKLPLVQDGKGFNELAKYSSERGSLERYSKRMESISEISLLLPLCACIRKSFCLSKISRSALIAASIPLKHCLELRGLFELLSNL